MKIKILNRYTNAVQFAIEADSKKQAIETGIKTKAVLRGADLYGADLREANLYGADLYGADLCGADLCGAVLCGAVLRGADLRGADLREANLYGAVLYGAVLRGADLRGAVLRGADLRGADLCEAKGLSSIVPEVGAFVGFKKLTNGVITKIQIPEDAGRVGGYIGRKCRAEKAIVLEGEGNSTYDADFKYTIGQTIIPDSWDPDPRVECSHGIHFFITKQEAIDYI